MIDLYTWATPDGKKISIMLAETEMPCNVHPVDIHKGEQFVPEYVVLHPNSRIPTIVDHDGPGGERGGAPCHRYSVGLCSRNSRLTRC